jgi:hypothetical protein
MYCLYIIEIPHADRFVYRCDVRSGKSALAFLELNRVCMEAFH